MKDMVLVLTLFCCLLRQKTATSVAAPLVATALQQEVPTQNVDWVYDPNEPRYCLCNQVCCTTCIKYTHTRLSCP